MRRQEVTELNAMPELTRGISFVAALGLLRVAARISSIVALSIKSRWRGEAETELQTRL
jgi:hypothetical protein